LLFFPAHLRVSHQSLTKRKFFFYLAAGMGIDPTQYGIIGAILRKLDNPNAVSLLSLFSLCNSVIAILRVLWFCVFSTCTWYAVLVACMFIHTHVGKFPALCAPLLCCPCM
jgi:hypothetical protein